jgi:hypothetical protein
MEKVRIMGAIAFSGELNPDPSSAAVALRRAGFEVTMMPEKFRSRLRTQKVISFQLADSGAFES